MFARKLNNNLTKQFNAATRKLSTESSSRKAIVQDILRYNAILNAKSEAEITAALKAPTIDVENLPSSVASLKGYLDAEKATASGVFIPDSKAWQNAPLGDFLAQESGRFETWPFLVGGLVTYLLFGFMLPMSLSSEGKKDSKYISYLHGNHGHVEGSHH
jgi:hypothetical protein